MMGKNGSGKSTFAKVSNFYEKVIWSVFVSIFFSIYFVLNFDF